MTQLSHTRREIKKETSANKKKCGKVEIYNKCQKRKTVQYSMIRDSKSEISKF